MISLVGVSPTILFWIAGAGFLFLSAMYLLRLRRRRVVVAHLPLWQKVVKQTQYQSLWQRLKRLFSWLLQIIMLLLLLFALGDPRLRAELFSGRQIVVVIDASASMQATDLGKSRLAVAKQKAEQLIQGLVGADRMMLIQMDAEVIPLTPFSSDKKLLRKALKRIVSSETAADLRRALLLAKDALQDRKRGEIVVLSDAAFGSAYASMLVSNQASSNVAHKNPSLPRTPPFSRKVQPRPIQKNPKRSVRRRPKRKKRRKKRGRLRRKKAKRKPKAFVLPPGLKKRIDIKQFSRKTTVHRKLPRFKWIQIGKNSQNVGIVALSARRLAQHPTQFSVYTELRNFSQQPVVGLLEFYVDQLIVETLQVRLKKGETWRHVLPRLTAQGQKLEARLKITKGKDLLPADNRAYAVLPKARPISVLLVSADNLYLQAALLSDVQVTFQHIGCKEALPKKTFDVLVYNQCAPRIEPTEGRFLFISPPAKGTPFRLRTRRGKVRVMKGPIITDVNRDHSVLRFVALRDLNIAESVVFRMRKGDRSVASSFGKPVFLSRETSTLRALAVGFALHNSDIALRMAFPLFLKNTVQWLMRGGRPLPPTARQTGKVWNIPLSAGIQKVQIQTPNKTTFQLPVHDSIALFGGKFGGFYTLSYKGGKRLIAANLSNPEESYIQPQKIRAQWLKTSVHKEAGSQLDAWTVWGFRIPVPKPLWLYVLLLVLLLFVIEWFTYNRRITV